ncbi:General transcription factor IIH subunit 2 [Coccomyxa sp. Obi]|nr:General transcription factor IIH subunit 2 [Coccomyxa sp. Obi]
MAASASTSRPPENWEEDDNQEADETAELEAFQRQYEDNFSWEALQEDEFGRLRPLDFREEQRAKRRRLLSAAATACIRRGMIRYLQIVVDLSRAASIGDMRPNRLAVMSGVLQGFIRKFFDENPLSHLGIVIMRNGIAQRLTDLAGSPEAHISKLQGNLDASGDASLQNAMDMAAESLKSIPPYGHREVLILFAALSTCDPGNVLDAVKAAKQNKIRVSVVGVAAEVHICRVFTQETGGTYGVALNEKHFEELVFEHAPPPPSLATDAAASLVRMGFANRNQDGVGGTAFIGKECKLSSGGFTCPRCKARVVDLPCSCHICGLTLISSPHLARSYHHLFPVKAFTEVPQAELDTLKGESGGLRERDSGFGGVTCYACLADLDPTAVDDGEASGVSVVVRCPECCQLFCFDCDAFIHETLHNCPGCLCSAGNKSAEDGNHAEHADTMDEG